MTAQPQTLFDIAGIQARIFTLPGRPAFMTAADLAEVYLTEPKRLAEAVKRNPVRFPDRYAFRLTEAEEVQMWSQFATTYGKKRADLRPLVFTHGGANMLASVLRGDVADQMAVAINDAFTAMEAGALARVQTMFAKLQIEEATRRPIRAKMILLVNAGLSFDAIWRAGNYTRAQVEAALRECLAMGAITALPPGMPPMQGDLFGAR